MKNMNYYEILEVSPNASPEVIKAAYKSLMQRHHPDKNPSHPQAGQHSQVILQAYQVLSDSTKRDAYDKQVKESKDRNVNSSSKASVILASNSRNSKNSATYGWLGTLLVLIFLVALAFSFVYTSSGKRQYANYDAAKDFSLLASAQTISHENTSSQVLAAIKTRTIPDFAKDVRVPLKNATDSVASAASNADYILSIPVIEIVAGAFDSDKFITFMESNKDYINRKLADKLAGVQHDALVNHNGELYLKQFILSAINEITNTNQSANSASPAHYGAVEIQLPESYTVVSPQHLPISSQLNSSPP
jgi:curved DNA-binding protein CbpA